MGYTFQNYSKISPTCPWGIIINHRKSHYFYKLWIPKLLIYWERKQSLLDREAFLPLRKPNSVTSLRPLTSASCCSLRSSSVLLCLCSVCSYSVLRKAKSCLSLALSVRSDSFSRWRSSRRDLNGPSTSEIICVFKASTFSWAGTW